MRNTVHKWNTADTITSIRIAADFFLLFLPLHSAGFLAVYFLAGLSDVLDGWLARKTGTASDFGARLDSIADLLFYGVWLLRLYPVLWQTMPAQIWYAAAVIFLVRLHTVLFCPLPVDQMAFRIFYTVGVNNKATR